MFQSFFFRAGAVFYILEFYSDLGNTCSKYVILAPVFLNYAMVLMENDSLCSLILLDRLNIALNSV